MTEAKYIQNIGEREADIFLYSTIGGPDGIDAQQFVKELQQLEGFNLDVINVRINSHGGSVLDGFGIYSAIKASRTKINTYVDGIAASIAGIIAMAGRERYIQPFGRLMIHDPFFNAAPEDLSDKQKEVLAGIKDSLVTLLTNETALTAEDISSAMSAETWYSATEAKDLGLVDTIVVTDRKLKKQPQALNSLEEVYNYAATVVAEAVKFKTNKPKMESLLNYMGLEAEAKEADAINHVKDLEAKAEQAEAKAQETQATLEELQNKLTELEAETEAVKETNANTVAELTNRLAKAVVANAIKDGKFSKDKAQELEELAAKDLDAFTAIANAAQAGAAQHVSVTELINAAKKDNDKPGKESWTIRDWEINDPKALKQMLNTNPEEYQRLYDAYYKGAK